MSAKDVCGVLIRLMATRGEPGYVRSDNGPEFVSAVLLEWSSKNGMTNMSNAERIID
jgi:putative transposase